MGTILVIGGAGYIGSHMVRFLADHGCPVAVLDNLDTGHPELIDRRAEFIQGDLGNPQVWKKVWRRSIDAVLHFAASSIVPESVQNPLKYYRNNVAGMVTLLEQMKAHRVNRLIFSSTAAVYGNSEVMPLNEDSFCQPANPYGHSKRMIEIMLQDVHRSEGLSYASLRYFNAAGAHFSGVLGEWHEPETHLIPNIMKVLLGEQQKLMVFGGNYPTPDGTCIRDYVHVEDLCEAHWLALQRISSGLAAMTVNLGTSSGNSVLEVVRAAEEVAGRKIPVEMAPRRAGDPARLVAGNKLAQKILGWKPNRNLRDIMVSAWNWHSRYEKKTNGQVSQIYSGTARKRQAAAKIPAGRPKANKRRKNETKGVRVL